VDTAAGQALLEAAGGQVTRMDGHRLRYNCRESLINGDFVAFSHPSVLSRTQSRRLIHPVTSASGMPAGSQNCSVESSNVGISKTTHRLHGEARHARCRDQRGRHVNLTALAWRHPRMQSDIAKARLSAPSEAGGARHRGLQVRLIRAVRGAVNKLWTYCTMSLGSTLMDMSGAISEADSECFMTLYGACGWKSR